MTDPQPARPRPTAKTTFLIALGTLWFLTTTFLILGPYANSPGLR